MEKKVIKQDNTTIVILKDYSYYPAIVVKGIAKCDPRDTFDAELGEKVANAKAWIKYYDKLAKSITSNLDDITDFIDRLTSKKDNMQDTLVYATEKGARIREELEELIKED